MKKLGTGLAVLLVLALFAVAVGALIYGVIEDPAVVGPLAAAFVAIGLAIYQRRWEKTQELERLHRDEMSPIYASMIDMVKTIDDFVKKPESEQAAFFKDTTSALLLHGPSPVVQAWVAWQRSLAIVPVSVPLIAQEELLLAIRTDLGHDNAKLQPGDLLRLWVNEEDNDEDRALWAEIKSRKVGEPREGSAT